MRGGYGYPLAGYQHEGPITSEAMLIELVNDVRTRGGASIHLPDNTRPVDGYMVSMAGHERTVPGGGFSLGWLKRYVLDHRDELRRPNRYLGLWADRNEDGTTEAVYADVSIRFDHRDYAILVGRQHAQKAIFDVANATEIRL